MRLLIDGYNLMHAAGRMNRRFGPDGLRRARHRFLNDLADALGPERAVQTTVVFDASSLPLNQPPESSHKGMTIIYAIEDEDADSRIELLIARDSAPRSLSVVSTDRRIRRAAERRRAASIPADEFLDFLDALRSPPRRAAPVPNRKEKADRPDILPPKEVETWLREFEGIDDDPIAEQAFGPGPADWTDEDLERVAREVEAEFRDVVRPLSPRSRRR
ncbi:NYN domain-containing protein [Tautonia sociabilis]|uniref:NYN domain-containing protein n=1 Tax=Tautonia sociabilis TaxID=2080755 RepID=A0A432MGF2_9BACT|nr:NYN domain-containing protein [Tautonia sociabilis]RUL85723.1 hypothetical protein TsocGM_17785 [Tautonia sociabilis]